MGPGVGAILGAWTSAWADGTAGVVIALAGLGIIVLNRAFWVRQAGLGLVVWGLLWGRIAFGPVPDPGWPATAADGTRTVLEGTVLGEPAGRAAGQEVWLELTGRRSALGWEPAAGRVVVRTAYAGPLLPGDRVVISGTLRLAGRSPDFDYRAWLAARGVSRVIYDGKVLAVEPGQSLETVAGRVRRWLGANLRSRLPPDEAALAEGLLLGLRSGLSAEAREAFNRTGTTHILVVSGYNVAVVGAVFLTAGRLVVGGWGWLWGLAGVGLYFGLVGPSPPTIRAAIMGMLALVGMGLGRPAWPANGLGLAIAAMLLVEPGLLADLSFQLSVLATAGIIFLVPVMQGWYLPRLAAATRPGLIRRAVLGAADGAAFIAAAWAATAPVILAGFRVISPVAIPVNLLIAPAVPPALFGSALLALAGPLGPLADLLAGAVGIPLGFILRVVWAFARLPGAAVGVGPWGKVEAALWLGALGALAFGPSRRVLVRTWPLGPACMLAGALLSAALLPTPARLDLYDLGGRRLLLAETSDGRVLIGSTRAPGSLVRTLINRLPAWDRYLDLVVWTDPGLPPAEAISALGREFKLGRVLAPDDLADRPEVGLGKSLRLRAYPGPRGPAAWVVVTVGEADVALGLGEAMAELPEEVVGAELVVPGDAGNGWEVGLKGYVVGTEGGGGEGYLVLPAGGRLTFWTDGQTVWPAGD